MNKAFFIFFILLSLTPFSEGADFSIRWPISAVMTTYDKSGKTWKQNGCLPVSFTAAVTQISACLRGQGWKQVQFIMLAKDKSRCIMVWQNGKKKITIMVWRILVDQSGFSWGINHD